MKTIELKTLSPKQEKTTVIKEIPERIKEFMDMPAGIAKNYRYSKLPYKDFETTSVYEKGKDIYFSTTDFKLSKNKRSYYFKVKSRYGLSFKENKLSIWYGRNIDNIPYLDELYNIMNWNFIEKSCKGYITKGILEKLFKGKITNSRDLLKEYAKSVRLKVSPELLYRAVVKGLKKIDFYRYGMMAENVDHFLQYYIDNNRINPHYSDLLEQFSILEKKINFRWSDKRVMQEHTEATKQLMDFEVGTLSDKKIEYKGLQIPKEFELLDNQKRTYIEGKTMNHCVYSNYWSRIQKGEYVALHVKLGEEDATLGLSVDKDNKLKFNQLYSYRNSQVSDDMKKFCNNWIEGLSEYKLEGEFKNKITANNEIFGPNVPYGGEEDWMF